MTENKIIVDAEKSVLGRVASFVAKQALLGKAIIIVNSDKVLITGNKRGIIEHYHKAAKRGLYSQKGPYLPRKDTGRMLKRTIRGMLSHRQQRGHDAFKRILCYPGIPAEYASVKMIKIERPIKTRTISLKEVSKELS